ncbi:hypothetical protein BO79DRAFT_251137 [Aspergillus costaricaensis CBS 115574]|uniref:Uncharacterized protein n=1 Tax=Aspergillus costaricaensis CBS 115574 TaxID=1448317 RepID=A0ACD1ISI3_9EURO|nr:hypothetical protein BO79DRAFT_251137 [Aspergillus costaricaensis CBS 115574]RAK92632.1 hypothetical protein BO79DRAFT_251137 [Aspergillus costaricaensis CBS 115574]
MAMHLGDDGEDTDNSNSDDFVNNNDGTDSNNDDNASSSSKPDKLTVHLAALLHGISD